MRKFISILMVVLAALIMLCACEPTVGDDGGEDEDRRVVELTFEIESLEAQVNGADSSTDLDALKDWAESCQLKIDTLKIEGKFEGLDALEARIEAVKNLIEVKRYPKAIYSDEEIEEMLEWEATNNLCLVKHINILGEAVQLSDPEPTPRQDGDVESVKEDMNNMIYYYWVAEDIIECQAATSCGPEYTYICPENKIEETKQFAESKASYPVRIDDEGFQAATMLLSQNPVYNVTYGENQAIAPVVPAEAFSSIAGMYGQNGIDFAIPEAGVIEVIAPIGPSFYLCSEAKKDKYMGVVEATKMTYPATLESFEQYNFVLDNYVFNNFTVGYTTKEEVWACDTYLSSSYATPAFFATVAEAKLLHEHVVELKMKGEPLKYVYVFNSDATEFAMNRVDLIHEALNM